MKRDVILFDLYQTLIDIWTDEVTPPVWDKLTLFLSYHELPANATALRDAYLRLVEKSQRESPERYPEVNVVGIFGQLLRDLGCPDAALLAPDVTRLFR